MKKREQEKMAKTPQGSVVFVEYRLRTTREIMSAVTELLGTIKEEKPDERIDKNQVLQLLLVEGLRVAAAAREIRRREAASLVPDETAVVVQDGAA